MNTDEVVKAEDEDADEEATVALAYQTEKRCYALLEASGTGLGWVLDVTPHPEARPLRRVPSASKRPPKPRRFYYARVEHALTKLCDMALADSGKLDGTLEALIAEVKRIRSEIIEPWGKGI